MPEEDPEGPPGHMVIPELRLSEYERDKNALKDKQLELARLASANIVLRPTIKPPGQ